MAAHTCPAAMAAHTCPAALAVHTCLAALAVHTCARMFAPQDFSCDAEPIVAHSCVVALDVLEHEKTGATYFAGTESAAA
eukprot:364114-Chlamydomonas_euryale.AAC.12